MSAPAVIVEPTPSGRFAVRCRPIFGRRDLERAFPAAWQAFDYAVLLAGELQAPVVDRTEVAE